MRSSQIEKSFHEAITKKDIDEMMCLWAPNATATVRVRAETRAGEGADPAGLARQLEHAFQAETTNWLSDHPAYKLEGHRQRRPRHAPLRVPLRRPADPHEIAAVTDGRISTSPGSTDSWLITNFVGKHRQS